MGAFVYLFGGIAKKRLVCRELGALMKTDRQNLATVPDEQGGEDFWSFKSDAGSSRL
jgi:hypothetical protein